MICENENPFKLCSAQKTIGLPFMGISGLGSVIPQFAKRDPLPAIGMIKFIVLSTCFR